MLPSLPRPQTPGFQGAERATVRIVVYNRTAGAEAAIFVGRPNIDFNGRTADGVPPVLSCSVQTSLNAGGSFAFSLHVAEGTDPCRAIEVDAWVDISFCRFDTCWHVLRGTVDEVRVRRSVQGNGATSIVAHVTGRSFQKAWETTDTFFSQLNASNILGADIFRVSASGLINSTPSINVKTVLFKYFDLIGSLGRANWAMPAAMPAAFGTLGESVLYDDALFDERILSRATVTGSMFFPDANIWDVATQQYSDPSFCELYTDILPAGGLLELLRDPAQERGLDPAFSHMSVVFRDKPFPRVDPAGQGQLGRASTWFKLPLYPVRRQELAGSDLGVSSVEVKNAFLTVGNWLTEDTTRFGGLKQPLWSIADMQRRGMRKLDAGSPYIPNTSAGTSTYSLFIGRRARLRDWYCMGGELRQGSLSLWRSFPQIRIGGRVRVLGPSPQEDFTAYIEGVQHQWDARSGAQTGLSVTRGWVGTDDALIARLTQVSGQYTLAPSRPTKG